MRISFRLRFEASVRDRPRRCEGCWRGSDRRRTFRWSARPACAVVGSASGVSKSVIGAAVHGFQAQIGGQKFGGNEASIAPLTVLKSLACFGLSRNETVTAPFTVCRVAVSGDVGHGDAAVDAGTSNLPRVSAVLISPFTVRRRRHGLVRHVDGEIVRHFIFMIVPVNVEAVVVTRMIVVRNGPLT